MANKMLLGVHDNLALIPTQHLLAYHGAMRSQPHLPAAGPYRPCRRSRSVLPLLFCFEDFSASFAEKFGRRRKAELNI